MRKLLVAGLLFLMAGLNACYYDKFDEMYPTTAYHDPCDTTLDTVYSQSIKLIVTYNCVTCHSSSNASGGIALDSYGNLKTQVDNGALYGTTHKQSNYNAMPPSGTLPDCQIQRLDAWIQKGAPQ
jgi:mono/diheme cytochrome c family protein